MRRRRVSFRPRADADLFGLYHQVAEEAGDTVAGDYVERIETFCRKLEVFPERGTRRDDIRPGIRTIGFERRATIVFQVKRSEVVIIRIFYGGQNWERRLRGRD